MVDSERRGFWAAIGGPAATALLLAGFAAPAIAASGHTPACPGDQNLELSIEIPADALLLEMVDLGPVTADSEDFDDVEIDTTAPAVTPTLRVDTILRRIFDETAPAGQERDVAAPIQSPNAAPLAELAAPGLKRQNEQIEESRPADTADGSNGFNAELPGVSDEELSRYRRQMFRTDI